MCSINMWSAETTIFKTLLIIMTVCFLLHAGMVTDGEFNSLRTQGETRPVHIWQLIHEARESVSRQKERTLLKFLKRLEVFMFVNLFI